jgi:hypothetical protein
MARKSENVDAFLSQLHPLPDAALLRQSESSSSLKGSTSASCDTTAVSDAKQPQEVEKKEPREIGQQTMYVQLSKDLAVAHAKDNIILVTWTNLHFLDFVENWITHLLKLGTFPTCTI